MIQNNFVRILIKGALIMISHSRRPRIFCAKRGIADTQFHWLFVILAGGFIFFFFALFINQGIAANQNKQTALMLQYFDGVLSSSQNVQNLNDPIESTPSITIEMRCEIGAQSKLVFVGQELEKKTTFLPIFSNYRLSGVAYALKTLPYDAPYRVDNPLYLTDTSTLYIVYNMDEDIREKYVRLLPSHATVVSTDTLSELTESGFRDVVIVTEDENSLTTVISGASAPDPLPAALKKANLRQVDVQTADSTVYYYYKFDASGDILLLTRSEIFEDASYIDFITYTDEATLLGGIMSEDPDLFECNLEKLNARARAIAMQISARAKQLAELPGMDTRCVSSYGEVRDQIEFGLANEDLTSQDTQDAITTENEQLIRYSCPTLY